MNTAIVQQPAGFDRIVARCADTLAFVRGCSDVAQVREVLAQASAVVAYLEGKGDGQAIAAAGEVRIVAERRLGELLAATVSKVPGNKRGTGDTASPVLSDLNISKKQSSRAQQLAAIPDEVFEAYVTERKASGRAPSKNGLLKAERDKTQQVVESEPHQIDARAAKRLSRQAGDMAPSMTAWGLLLRSVVDNMQAGVVLDPAIKKRLKREAEEIISAARALIKQLEE